MFVESCNAFDKMFCQFHVVIDKTLAAKNDISCQFVKTIYSVVNTQYYTLMSLLFCN